MTDRGECAASGKNRDLALVAVLSVCEMDGLQNVN